MNGMPHVSWDLDSTLADTRHRQGMIEEFRQAGKPIDWVAYSLACEQDQPTDSVVLLKIMQQWGVPWHVVSGRSEPARVPTLAWLARQGLFPKSVNLCDDEEAHSRLGHVQWKARRVVELGEIYPIRLHVDDYAGVAELVEKLSDGNIKGVLVAPPGWSIVPPQRLDNPL